MFLALMAAAALCTPADAGCRDGELYVDDAAVAPYFDAGAWAWARKLMDQSNPRAALAAMPEPQSPQERYLHAAALAGAVRNLDAAMAFEALAPGYPALADRCEYQAGQLYTKAGRPADAAAALARVSPRFVAYGRALLERARALRTAARLDDALAALQPILDGSVVPQNGDAADALEMAGRMLQEKGRIEEARAMYRRAWLDFPLASAAGPAREAARRLPPGPAVAPERQVARAETILDAHKNREAMRALQEIPLPPLCGPQSCEPAVPRAGNSHGVSPRGAKDPVGDPLACRARLALGKAWRKERQHAQAVRLLDPVARFCPEELSIKALYLQSRSAAVAEPGDVPRLLGAISTHAADHAYGDDALFFEAELHRRAGDAVRERRALRALVEQHRDGDYRAEALFRLFWSLRAEGRAQLGLHYLDRLQREYPGGGTGNDPADAERARYWRARTLLEIDPGAAALDELRWLAEHRPMTYYGLLARGRLAELQPSAVPSPEAPPEIALRLRVTLFAADPHLRAGMELVRLGFREEAAAELRAVDRRPALSAGKPGREALVGLADLMSRAGDARSAHAVVRGNLPAYLRRAAGPLSRRAAELAYPPFYRALVAVHAPHAFDALGPELMLALMREESALDPLAVSPAGAVGLTQMMPATARALAHRLGIRGFQPRRLTEPEIAIRLGTYFLGKLLDRFGHPALALAAYNAGPTPVVLWQRERGHLPLDAFVEEIPIDETRGYVKRVLRSYAAYRYLYGEGEAREATVAQSLAR